MGTVRDEGGAELYQSAGLKFGAVFAIAKHNDYGF